jgi:hypothetical protein
MFEEALADIIFLEHWDMGHLKDIYPLQAKLKARFSHSALCF